MANGKNPYGKQSVQIELSDRCTENKQDVHASYYEEVNPQPSTTETDLTKNSRENGTDQTTDDVCVGDQTEEEGWTENSVYETSAAADTATIPVYATVNNGSNESLQVQEGWEDNVVYESSTEVN